MTQDDLTRYAIQKTVKMLADCGFKYRKLELANTKREYGCESYKLCRPYVEVAMSGKVLIKIPYLDEQQPERGRRLKKEKNQFLMYFNCNVREEYIIFIFSKKELEIEYIRQEDVEESKVEQIMEKVKKLLALSQSECNEHEAISASLMAQKLLAKYNIDIEEVTGEPKEEEIEETLVDVGTGNSWKYALAFGIADNYCCKCYASGSEKFYFRGYRSDIMIARQVFAYLFSVCKRLGKAYEREYRKNTVGSAEGVFNSYCAGFVQGVKSELAKQCRALALVTPKPVEEDWKGYSEKFKTMNASERLSMSDYEAYEKGERDGKDALNAQYIAENGKYIEA